MLERRSGVILNFSSTAGYNGMVRKTHYVTAKASLRAFTKAVALEVGQYGIRCNCIVPGSIDTELWRNWVKRTADEQGLDYETHRARLLRGVALRDISSTDDVANLALFLASDESRTITGQSIPVDAGGVHAGLRERRHLMSQASVRVGQQSRYARPSRPGRGILRRRARGWGAGRGCRAADRPRSILGRCFPYSGPRTRVRSWRSRGVSCQGWFWCTPRSAGRPPSAA